MLRITSAISVAALAFLNLSCVNLVSDPEEDSCSKGRVTVKQEGYSYLLGTANDHFLITDVADVNCHGKFQLEVTRGDSNLSRDTSLPPIYVSFGTDWIMGSDFPMTVRKEVQFRTNRPKDTLAVWFIYEADNGAKNLNQEMDWKYVTYASSTDTSVPLSIRWSSINYKTKKK